METTITWSDPASGSVEQRWRCFRAEIMPPAEEPQPETGPLLPHGGTHHRRPACIGRRFSGYEKHNARDGEMPYRDWLTREALKRNRTRTCIMDWVHDGRYQIEIRTVNCRVKFVVGKPKFIGGQTRREYINGVKTKEWKATEAARLGISVHNLEGRLSRGTVQYPEEKKP